MAYFLNRGQVVTLGTGTAEGTGGPSGAIPLSENTIQSFNGDLFKYNQSFYVDIILATQTISAAVTVTGLQTFDVTVPGDAFTHYKFEVGDSVVLGDGVDNFNAEIVTVTPHSTVTGTGTLELRLTDPHAEAVDATQVITAADIDNPTGSRVDINVDGTFAAAVGHDVPFSEVNSLSVGNYSISNAAGIQEIDFLYDETTPPDSEFRIFTFNSLQADVIVSQVEAEIAAGRTTLTLNFNRTDTTFTTLNAEKELHIGSKNTNSTAIVLPVTLPTNLSIRAGEGIEDIFLINNPGA